jgi:nicotinate-nucleotide adenylyltransferase
VPSAEAPGRRRRPAQLPRLPPKPDQRRRFRILRTDRGFRVTARPAPRRSSSGRCARSARRSATRSRSQARRSSSSDTGIFGGIFDPPHNGHVALARRRWSSCRSAACSCSSPPPRGHRKVVAPPEERLQLARLAFDFADEVALDEHAFTVDSVRDGRFGGRHLHRGADEGAAFPTWKEPDEVLRHVRLALGTRTGYAPPDLEGYGDRVLAFEFASPPVSSSDVRERIARGEPVDELVQLPSHTRSRNAASTAATLMSNRRGLDETLTPLEHARRIAGLAQEKLAQDVLILDMRPVCSYTDFFVLATGQNPRQTKAIWDEVHERLKHDEDALPTSVAASARDAGSSPTTSTWSSTSSRPSRASTTGSRSSGATFPSIELVSATA